MAVLEPGGAVRRVCYVTVLGPGCEDAAICHVTVCWPVSQEYDGLLFGGVGAGG